MYNQINYNFKITFTRFHLNIEMTYIAIQFSQLATNRNIDDNLRFTINKGQ